MIELTDLQKTFNQGRHNEVRAVRGVSLTLAPRLVTVFKGPSGSGKTSLLSMIGCLSRPTAGRIALDGKLISNLPERFMTLVRRETFGFIFQTANLIRGLSVLENLMLPAYPLAPPPGVLRARAMELLQRLGLADQAEHRAEWLSGGEAQRAAICRAMINRPRVLIADEPTANLDSRLSAEVVEILADLVDDGMTVLISSHDPLVIESNRVSAVIEMRDGLILPAASETPSC